MMLEENEALEEDMYRRQLRSKWGYSIGDPRLTSMDADGSVIRGRISKKVDE